MDLKGAVKFGGVLALLIGAWVLVKALKPREAELPLIDSRGGDFGDMTSAAQKRAAASGDPTDVSGLDMVPTTSLPLSGPSKPEPAPEPAPAAPAPASPAPEPAPAPAPPRRVAREKPVLQRTGSVLEGSAATSSAFLAAPEDEKKEPKR